MRKEESLKSIWHLGIFWANVMDFIETFTILQNAHETDRIEAKAALQGIGMSFLETVCSFANEPGLGGGYILLGVAENQVDSEKNFTVIGIKNPDELQQAIASQCRQSFNVPIRPKIQIFTYQEKNVILVYVEEMNPHDKPIYILKLGQEKGCFRRIGSTDQVCTRDDLDYLYQLRSQKSYDQSSVTEASIDELDADVVQQYRKLRSETYTNAVELKYSDEDLLKSLRAICFENGAKYPTVAGILLFGTQEVLRRLFPLRNRCDYILVEGRKWMPSPERHHTIIEVCEPLITAIPKLHSQIMNDIPQQFALELDGLRRKDNPVIPRNVIRESLVNAIMHRDYRVPSPVQIIKYANRIEFRNRGYSLKPFEELDLPGSVPRNETIANVFNNIRYAEEKGSGISSMRAEMKHANLSVPLIESNRSSNTFVLTLLSHHLFNQSDIDWLKLLKDYNLSNDDARTLIVLREMGAITNSDYRTINRVDTLTASSHLRKLRDQGLLQQKGSGSTTYYTLSPDPLIPQVEGKPGMGAPQVEGKPGMVAPQVEGKPGMVAPQVEEKARGFIHQTTTRSISERSVFSFIPDDLENRIQKLKKKTDVEDLQSILKELCFIKPLKVTELASILGRSPRYLREYVLKPMIFSGRIRQKFPNQPRHPDQAYLSLSSEIQSDP